ncbi:hypothetical protein G9U51_08895 [Calidifontibacter sp. DB0510]|uniref:Uncharacterized protein n=1 Tax=Metallococcus carri TaxID=1656884 RepID=A0A967AZC4_9MICO|nr:hypothetical protein [Metallococcus carri]NHN55889.1 hypothetical protein [Metallococcus carri]NOP38423.1 hypothetical protein [Calidifontibacter sp. DB2511S]
MTLVPRLDRLIRIDRGRVVALAMAVVAALAFHLCAVAAGSTQWFELVLVVLACLFVLIRTDGTTELLLLAALVLDWWVADPPSTSWWALPAAVCLLAVHSATALGASGPDAAPLPRPLVLRWVLRTAVVAAGGVAVGALVIALRRSDVSGPWYAVPAALVTLALAVVAVGAWLTRHPRPPKRH